MCFFFLDPEKPQWGPSVKCVFVCQPINQTVFNLHCLVPVGRNEALLDESDEWDG